MAAAVLSRFGRGLILLCCVGVASFGAQRALAGGLRPEPAPPSHGGPLQPEPIRGAAVPQSVPATQTGSVTSSVSSLHSSGLATGSTTSSHAGAAARAAQTSTADRQPSPHAARKRAQALPRATANPLLPFWASRAWRRAEATFGSRHGSPESQVPLAAAVALLVLVLGDALFLGLAASRFGVLARRRPSAREAAYPVRRVVPKL